MKTFEALDHVVKLTKEGESMECQYKEIQQLKMFNAKINRKGRLAEDAEEKVIFTALGFRPIGESGRGLQTSSSECDVRGGTKNPCLGKMALKAPALVMAKSMGLVCRGKRTRNVVSGKSPALEWL